MRLSDSNDTKLADLEVLAIHHVDVVIRGDHLQSSGFLELPQSAQVDPSCGPCIFLQTQTLSLFLGQSVMLLL